MGRVHRVDRDLAAAFIDLGGGHFGFLARSGISKPAFGAADRANKKLGEGDAVSFFAEVDSPDAEVFAKAQTDKYNAVISHTLKTPPEEVQAQSAVSENVLPTAEVQPARSQALWICVLLCLALAGLIGVRLYKQWMPWFKKTFIKSK